MSNPISSPRNSHSSLLIHLPATATNTGAVGVPARTTHTPLGGDHVALDLGGANPADHAGAAPCGSMQWFAEAGARYVAKPLCSAIAGALVMSPLAIAVVAAMDDPVASGPIAAVGGAVGLAAGIAKLADQPHFSEALMKGLGSAYRAQATAMGSAFWATRFSALDEAQQLAEDMGWSEDLAPLAQALMRAVFVVAYTMAVPDMVAATNVATSALEEGIARIADMGETPLYTPVLKDLGKSVIAVFSTSAVSIGVVDLARHLQPGEQAPADHTFNALLNNLPGSPMAVSAAMGFLCWAVATVAHMKEAGQWNNLGGDIEKTAVAVQRAAGARAHAEAMGAGKDAGAAELARQQAIEAEIDSQSACGNLRLRLAAVGRNLKRDYVGTAGGAMTTGVASPFAGYANPLGDSRGAQALGFLAKCGTSPLTAMAVFAMCEQQVTNAKHDDDPGAQAALYMGALTAFTVYWLGLLNNWIELKAPPAVDRLNATPRTASTECLRALMMIVGTFGAAYAFDSLLDEADPGRHQGGQFAQVTDPLQMMGAAMVGFGAQIISLVLAGSSNVATTRAVESTMMAAAGMSAGAFDGGAYGAGSAAAGMAAGQIASLLRRFQQVQSAADEATLDTAVAGNDKKAKAAASAASEAVVKAFEEDLGKKSPEDRAAILAAFAAKFGAAAGSVAGGRQGPPATFHLAQQGAVFALNTQQLHAISQAAHVADPTSYESKGEVYQSASPG